MTWHLSMRVALAAAALCGLSACGGARPIATHSASAEPPAPVEPPEPPEPEPEEPPPPSEPPIAPVSAGLYRLSLSTTCKSRE
jgi:hypothetical protein